MREDAQQEMLSLMGGKRTRARSISKRRVYMHQQKI